MILFIQTKKNEQTKQNKLMFKFIKVINKFNLPVGMWDSKPCQFHAAHASFILFMLFLALQRVILQKCLKYLLLETGLSWFSSNITF